MVDFLLIVGITLFLSLTLGEGVRRTGQPGFLGELIAGIILGPSLLGLVDPDGFIEIFATIGAMLLFFDIGYEQIDLEDLLSAGRPVITIAAFGFALPFCGGLAIGLLFSYPISSSVFFGVALSLTSTSITARTLMSFDSLDTIPGQWLLGAAVTDDITGLLVLSLLPALFITEGLQSGAILIGRVALFALCVGIFYRLVVDRLSVALKSATGDEADFLAVMTAVFLFGYGAEFAGLSATIGALAAGLIVATNRRFKTQPLQESVAGVAYGVFIPLYFASIGAALDFGALSALGPFVLIVIVVGLVSKWVAGYIGARVAGGTSTTASTVAIGLLPRSESGVVVIAAGMAQGIIDRRLFLAYLSLLIVSILISPSLLKRTLSSGENISSGDS